MTLLRTMPLGVDIFLQLLGAFSGLGGIAAVVMIFINGINNRKERSEREKRENDSRDILLNAQNGENLRYAITHLGSDSEAIRIGALYELVRIAVDSARDRKIICNIISTFTRDSFEKQNAEIREKWPDTAPKKVKLWSEIDTALECLSYLNKRFPEKCVSDLHEIDAEFIDLRLKGVFLRKANLQNAKLQGAYLVEAEFQGAYLVEAKLQGAYLRLANLQGADLRGADLQGASLGGANFQGADLGGANFQGADLGGANLMLANLQGAFIDEITIIDDNTQFPPGVREKYFPWYKPENEQTDNETEQTP